MPEKQDAYIIDLNKAVKSMRPAALPMPGLKPGDWLSVYHEPGQSFEQFLLQTKASLGLMPKKIYLVPVGDFTDKQQKAVQSVMEFLQIFFNLPVEAKPSIPLADIPQEAQRFNPLTGQKQILTRYIMEERLLPVLQKEPAAYLAFTATDLWTGEGSNFVFGEASGDDPMGIWSMARYGDLEDDAGFKLCLLRILKVATHECGHMFGLMHCTRYACGMNGYNSLSEEDTHPLAFCPECMAKICSLSKITPREHCLKAVKFLQAAGLDGAAGLYEDYLNKLKK